MASLPFAGQSLAYAAVTGVSPEQAEQSGADHRLAWSANRAHLVDVTGAYQEESAKWGSGKSFGID
jgi:hypothetical protein